MKKVLFILVAVALLGIAASSLYNSSESDVTTVSSKTESSISSTSSTNTPLGQSSTVSASPTVTTGTPIATTNSSYKDGSYQGADYTNRYGDVQVSITIASGKITEVNFDRLVANDSHSEQINIFAASDLQSQALSAQSADIDGVSGATITSNSYIKSLQSALDKAAV